MTHPQATPDVDMLRLAAQAELEMRRRGLRRVAEVPTFPSFSAWLPEVTPEWRWDWPHLRYMQRAVERCISKRDGRLLVMTAPRHGKSEQNTVRLAAYCVERDPTFRIIMGGYAQTFINKLSRKTRKLVRARGKVALSTERNAAEDWETEAGGGVRAAGVGAGVTGMGCNGLIIDDPIKSRAEANSLAYREATWEWFTDDVYTRLEPGAWAVATMTRWHDDDLMGRILASEDGPNWEVVKLPALAEENDPLGRAIGEALCPDRYDREALLRIQKVQRNNFWSLFQQTPRPKEGGFFLRSWFEIVPASWAIAADRVRYWDMAATDGDGDWTVGVLMAKTPDGYYVVEDLVRGQWSPGTRDRKIRETAELDADRYGRDRVRIRGPQDPGAAGKSAALDFCKQLDGYPVRCQPESGDKQTRAEPFASAAESGRVKLTRAPWNTALLNELCDFPFGKHDDVVDGCSGAYRGHQEKRKQQLL